MSRTPFVPAELLSKLWRAVIEFDMLQAGDKILIGLSGGKDSMFLTAALAEIQKYAPVPFELACYTVDAMFSPAFPKAELEAFCGYYGLKHYSEKVDVNSAWQNKGNTPCFTCAYFRRAATNRTALELGFNKVALAHHHDDAVETFFDERAHLRSAAYLFTGHTTVQNRSDRTEAAAVLPRSRNHRHGQAA